MASVRYTIDEDALRLAEMMDGKLLVVTNVQDMALDKVMERYKSLADIERGFKVLKSELEIGPVYHRLPERIRAHASMSQRRPIANVLLGNAASLTR